MRPFALLPANISFTVSVIIMLFDPHHVSLKHGQPNIRSIHFFVIHAKPLRSKVIQESIGRQ